MNDRDNGQPPGYQVPSFNAMQDDQLVAYVPRPILCVIVLLCAGVGVLSRSWGALLLYVMLHAGAAYLTYRDPRWLQVLVEAIRFRFRVFRLRFREASWRQLVRASWVLGALGICLVYGVFIWFS